MIQDEVYSNLCPSFSSLPPSLWPVYVFSQVPNVPGLCVPLTRYLCFILISEVLVWIARLPSFSISQCEDMIGTMGGGNVAHIFIRYLLKSASQSLQCLFVMQPHLLYPDLMEVVNEVWQNLYVFSWLKFAVKIQAVWAVCIDLWIYLQEENVTFAVQSLRIWNQNFSRININP